RNSFGDGERELSHRHHAPPGHAHGAHRRRRTPRSRNPAATTRRRSQRLLLSRSSNRRSTALSLARSDDRLRPSLPNDRGAQTQPRRNGGREAERFALAPVGRPGLSRREQEVSEAAPARL